ncbi:MAG: hypothetical protein H7123_08415 [Thermoleophilia bacterium]|nr:hypothetical protein [Thermoleophilia bacterium]
MTTSDDTPTQADDTEDDVAYCYRHPNRETALSCIDCERPICTDCARTGAVGLKCPECAKMPRTALARIPRRKLVIAIVVGVAVSIVAGVVHTAVGGVVGFLGLITAWFLGMGIGEVMRRAAGGFRDPLLGYWAAGCAAVGFLLLPALLLINGANPARMVFAAIYAAIAAFSAYRRAE